ncbi:hypothetical protein [Crocosphaera sp. XPORK-15E]|uniref:hypothetical protein n=1 Tax=Crocosphaera sp. XPORK-15E TaxID=3110247 RepID=UPI002B20ED10|nr:hypothetical protein [Crocosphaera sp. XPORK-15E]MEA5534418.1 hypothetical protein [Crocosphaera sp. XPORK-15E]
MSLQVASVKIIHITDDNKMANNGNTLREDSNNLVSLDYSDILNKIIEVLQSDKSQQLFKVSEDGKRLLMNIDEIAYQVACLSIASPFSDTAKGTKCASINLRTDLENQFSSQLKNIQKKIKHLLQKSLRKPDNQSRSIQEYIDSIAIPLTDFKGAIENNKLGFNYPFDKENNDLQKQRLTVPKDHPDIKPLLRFHKLTINVKKPTSFLAELKNSLANFIDGEEDDKNRFSEDEQENLKEILESLFENQDQQDNGIGLIKKLMVEEALGKLQKAAKIQYLYFLYEQVKTKDNAIYLKDLIRRLEMIETYINDKNKPDEYYKVYYQGVDVNYREFFNTSYAFEYLPIIPKIEGYLGEINDKNKEQQEFVFGLKLKLNGKVQTEGGIDSFNYHLSCLDLDSKENKDKLGNEIEKSKLITKALKIVFLYYFVFASRSNPLADDYERSSELNYDPQKGFEQFILPILKGSDDQKKKNLFNQIKKGFEQYNIPVKINRLKSLLTDLIKNPNSLKTGKYDLKISVSKGILEKDADTIDSNNTLFKPGLNTKAALKYISIDKASVNSESLCRLTVEMKINDIRYFPTQEKQTFRMEYDLRDIKTIPIVLFPKENRCQTIYNDNFKENNLIVCYYNYERLKKEIFNNADNPKAFWYQLTFSLLKYISLKVFLDEAKNPLFIPLLRLHLTDGEDASPEEKFMRSCSYVLSHIFNEKHRFSSQGFCIKNINTFKIRNSLSSLYSILPKIFSFDNYRPKLDKLAIIVVSSRECDRHHQHDYKITNMMGEVICLYRQKDQKKDQTIRLYNQGTFANNYNSQQIHNNPDILIEKVNELYKQGYRHFLYIAKSPYSSSLNITGTDKDLFFMSPQIIRALKGDKEDIKIYPIFFDKYSAVKVKNAQLEVNSLYIQDPSELLTIMEDSSQQSLVFFNLFNGITIAKDTHYNGVISYTTLLNIYEGILDDMDIRLGLINDNQMKTDLLNYLTLFHFSRYEAASGKINLKLDPYKKLIGDDSVGALSIFKHSNNKTEFNSLAFLAEVRRLLNIKPDNEETELCQS